MSKYASMTVFAVMLTLTSAPFLGGPVLAQTAQQPTTTAPAAAPTTSAASPTTAPTTATTTTPGAAAMPMEKMPMGHGPGMGMPGGQGHPGAMMGGEGHQAAPMGRMPPCPVGQTPSGNPPTCR